MEAEVTPVGEMEPTPAPSFAKAALVKRLRKLRASMPIKHADDDDDRCEDASRGSPWMIDLDTSAVVSMSVPEPASPAIDACFEACTDPLLAADWIVPESSSALSTKVRGGEVDAKHMT